MTDEEVKSFVGNKVKAKIKVEWFKKESKLFEEEGTLEAKDMRLSGCTRIWYVFKEDMSCTPYNSDDFVSIQSLESDESMVNDYLLKKPPLGLKPKYVRIDQRIEEIKAAVNRCFVAKYPIKLEWIEEYNELVESEKTEK